MGFLSSLFGSSKSQPQVTQIQQTQKLPPEIAPKVAEVADESKRLYDERVAEGYVPYAGATIAPFTQQELDAQAAIEGLVGTSAPLQQEALGITRQAGEQFTGDVAQQYMNPYQQAVIDIEKRKAQEDFTNRILPQFEKQGVAAGGMSGLGSRAGVQAALLGEAQSQRLGDIQSKGLQQSFLQGRAEFNAQKIRERQQAQDLNKAGPAMFASGLAEQGALTGVGEQRRELGQSALDEAYFRFLEERGEPQAALAEYSNTIYGNPLNTIPSFNRQTTAPGQQGPSAGSQLLGLGMQAASMYYGGGFGAGAGAVKGAAEGGRLNEGLSGVVYRQTAGAIGEPAPRFDVGRLGNARDTITEMRILAKQLKDAGKPDEAEAVERSIRQRPPINSKGTVIEDTSYYARPRRDGLFSRLPSADLGLGLYAQTPKTLTGGLQTIEEVDKASLSPEDRRILSKRQTPLVDGNGITTGKEEESLTVVGDPQPADPNAQPTDPLAYPRQTMLELLGKLGDKTSRDETLAQRVALAEKSKDERTALIIEQRKSEAEAFDTLSKSQTTRLADEMLRRKEEVTGRDWNITLSKMFGVGAKSFSDPNKSITRQIAGAMAGMTETMVSERVLKREQLSELDKEEFDKETVIIDRKLSRNLETMQKNNKQDLSVLNLDRAGQKELAALPAQKRKDILTNAASLASIFDDLLPDADSTKIFDISKTREDLRGAVAAKFGFVFDAQTKMITKNGKPLQGADARRMSNLTEYAIKVLNDKYQINPTKTGASSAYVSASAEAEAARQRMDALGPEATPIQLEEAMRRSTAPVMSPRDTVIARLKEVPVGKDRDEAIAFVRSQGYNDITAEDLN